MRVDLLDRDGETLEQFRVIAFTVSQDIGSNMQALAKANLPPLLSVPGGEKTKFNWSPSRYRKALAKFPAAVVRCRRWITCLSNRGFILTVCLAFPSM